MEQASGATGYPQGERKVASMRRILLVVSVAALMAAMLVVMAVPAFAAPAQDACIGVATSAQASTDGQAFSGPVSQRQGDNAANTTGYKDLNCPSGPA